MKVVYSEQMVAELLHHTSPSSYKPKKLFEYLVQKGYALEQHDPVGLTPAQLALAHHPEYVSEVLECREENGFGNKDPDIARTLPFTSGSLYVAGRLALEHGIASSFSSGFHHAHYERGGGFCTFNGLVVAARMLQAAGLIRTCLILDLDYHYGDGTQNILDRLELSWIRHETFGLHFRWGSSGSEYLKALGRTLESIPQDLILYQAGADVHVDDPLGGVLTSAEMEERDKLVFEAARRHKVPLAWNLAGGYQRDENGSILPVLRLHEQTYRQAEQIYGRLEVAS